MGTHKNKRENYYKRIITIVIIICLGTAMGVLVTPIFDVQEAYCEGNHRISPVTIIEKAQVEIGKNIIFQRLHSMEKRIKEIPEIEDVDVKRVFPNIIKITVAERVPAGYFIQDDKCIATDLEGRVLNIIDGEQALGLISYLTPEKLEGRPEEKKENTEKKEQENFENSKKSEDTGNPNNAESANDKVEDKKEEDGENSKENTETENVSAVNIPYEIPLVLGIEIKPTEVGKIVQSKENAKLDKIFELINCLEKAGLLTKVTYLDATNLDDIIFVIEKRLEVQLGGTDNLEYRCAFLAKVVNEKISLTEHAILDYKDDDVFVRQPDDGKERVVPKPTPEPSFDSEEEVDDKPEESAEINGLEE